MESHTDKPTRIISQITHAENLDPLVERVGASSPPSHEDRQADRLKQLGENVDAHLLQCAFLDE